MKALLDLGEPSISLECSCCSIPRVQTPLLLLAYTQSMKYSFNCQAFDKIALLLSRGANVKATNPLGETCLHLVLKNPCPGDDHFWCRDEVRARRQLSRIKDIAILMISAGADVCAIDEGGRSVSDIANHSGQQPLWTDALKYCGIDIKDVLARRNSDPAYSTALSPAYSQPSRSVTSKISLEQYLERRKAYRVPEENEKKVPVMYSSSEDDDSGEDEDSNHDTSSLGDDESKDEDSVEETSEIADVSQKKAIREIGGTHIQHEGEPAKGKAKPD